MNLDKIINETFQDGVEDARKGRFGMALAKFKSVLAIQVSNQTPSATRFTFFWISKCFTGLHSSRLALDTFHMYYRYESSFGNRPCRIEVPGYIANEKSIAASLHFEKLGDVTRTIGDYYNAWDAYEMAIWCEMQSQSQRISAVTAFLARKIACIAGLVEKGTSKTTVDWDKADLLNKEWLGNSNNGLDASVCAAIEKGDLQVKTHLNFAKAVECYESAQKIGRLPPEDPTRLHSDAVVKNAEELQEKLRDVTHQGGDSQIMFTTAVGSSSTLTNSEDNDPSSSVVEVKAKVLNEELESCIISSDSSAVVIDCSKSAQMIGTNQDNCENSSNAAWQLNGIYGDLHPPTEVIDCSKSAQMIGTNQDNCENSSNAAWQLNGIYSDCHTPREVTTPDRVSETRTKEIQVHLLRMQQKLEKILVAIQSNWEKVDSTTVYNYDTQSSFAEIIGETLKANNRSVLEGIESLRDILLRVPEMKSLHATVKALEESNKQLLKKNSELRLEVQGIRQVLAKTTRKEAQAATSSMAITDAIQSLEVSNTDLEAAKAVQSLFELSTKRSTQELTDIRRVLLAVVCSLRRFESSTVCVLHTLIGLSNKMEPFHDYNVHLVEDLLDIDFPDTLLSLATIHGDSMEIQVRVVLLFLYMTIGAPPKSKVLLGSNNIAQFMMKVMTTYSDKNDIVRIACVYFDEIAGLSEVKGRLLELDVILPLVAAFNKSRQWMTKKKVNDFNYEDDRVRCVAHIVKYSKKAVLKIMS